MALLNLKPATEMMNDQFQEPATLNPGKGFTGSCLGLMSSLENRIFLVSKGLSNSKFSAIATGILRLHKICDESVYCDRQFILIFGNARVAER